MTTAHEMAGKLLAAGFQRAGPAAGALSDPIADTPMVVTLDQLRPYDHDPRVKKNPAYDDIKASIRERGLDAPPAITRRPGEEHFIIRNGGNTRLAILRELWGETKQERFFRISCLFRPWPERGEIVALTGHLAENELRGNLTFIERALGVEKARGFYEQESGSSALNQSELSKRLTADGYPVQQSHISRMQDAVRYLLPAIPNVLYGGLGRHQVERVAVLRKTAERIWEQHAAGARTAAEFEPFFGDVLMQFDTAPEDFSVQRVQDELVGQMAELFGIAYDTLHLAFTEGESRHRVLVSKLGPDAPVLPEPPPLPVVPFVPSVRPGSPHGNPAPMAGGGSATRAEPRHGREPEDDGQRVQGHVVSQAPTTDRLQSIQQMVASQLGDGAAPDFERNALQAIPVQAGGLYPISDVWYIDPGLDTPERLRVHIGQFAREIADEAALGDAVAACDEGIGFVCAPPPAHAPRMARSVWLLLASLSGHEALSDADCRQLVAALPALLHDGDGSAPRLSDTALVKLFRLSRLARRLFDLESGVTP